MLKDQGDEGGIGEDAWYLNAVDVKIFQ